MTLTSPAGIEWTRIFSSLSHTLSGSFVYYSPRSSDMASTDGEHEAVTTLREYLRVRTDHPQPDYAAAVAFLQRYLATHLPELPTRIVGSHADRPILIATLEGSDPTLPSILLNSHTDVVMADRARWDHEPFAAIKDEQQRIYGRGVQDMKSVTIQYLEAIRTIKRELDASGQKVHSLIERASPLICRSCIAHSCD